MQPYLPSTCFVGFEDEKRIDFQPFELWQFGSLTQRLLHLHIIVLSYDQLLPVSYVPTNPWLILLVFELNLGVSLLIQLVVLAMLEPRALPCLQSFSPIINSLAQQIDHVNLRMSS